MAQIFQNIRNDIWNVIGDESRLVGKLFAKIEQKTGKSRYQAAVMLAIENRLKWSWKGPMGYEQNSRNKVRRVYPVYDEPTGDWHNGDAFCVNSTQDFVFDPADQQLPELLLESFFPKIFLSNFPNQTLKWLLTDQQLCTFLITANFTKSHCSCTIAM
ncbi:hypothetical protein T02_6999 [Trichinella nativa]|uniref:Uncharacterized protein n=1 Tax=Trichinella nativa TaxID=6335 RepID=A0A0V1KPT9_9BILA|nr:hypothetical protein T02_6999 [Trichinella nativa]